jgi:hypothetical protein
MVSANPQLREVLSNPDMMRNMMTPENMNAAMNMMGNGGMGGMGGMGGFGGMGGGMGGAGTGVQPNLN